MSGAVETPEDVLAELRRARRRQRVAELHWADALYNVYITAILSVVIVAVVSGLVGDKRLTAHGIATASARGPAALGLVAALALMVGLRSGSRGGPLALEKPDVRHVLLSPVDRGAALRAPAFRQLRFLTFAAAASGGLCGRFAERRFGGNFLVWIVCGALFGAAVVWLSVGAALVASGHRVRPWLASIIGLVLVSWSVADVAQKGPTAPLSYLGRLPFWALQFDGWALLALLVCIGVAVFGVMGVSGISLEAAERRTSLVGQMKFAVTLQDLRTVLVLRRQLAMELPRSEPWLGKPARVNRPARFPVWRRGWRGVLRWPLVRVLRLMVLAVVAGLALRGMWSGTTPLLVLAGFALWIAALDAIEPLAQETDHPGRLEMYPEEVGQLMIRHLPVSFAAMTLVGLVASLAAFLAAPSVRTIQVAAIALIPGAMAAVGGAVVSVLMGAPKPFDTLSMTSPEIAGVRNVMRAVWPPMVAVIGTVPVLVARIAVEKKVDMVQVELATAFAVLIMMIIISGWVRFRADIHDWWEKMMEEAKAAQEERKKAMSARRPAASQEEDA